MTPENLIKMGVRADRAAAYAPALNQAFDEFGINTPIRQAAFMAQVLHESARLKTTREGWGPTSEQLTYERDFSQPWGPELKRGDRNFKPYGLGNSEPGDGFRFRGRGLLQNTGRNNYLNVGKALGVDLIKFPESLETPLLAVRSAAWWWREHGLNELADTGDTKRISRRINGGDNGLDDRLALYEVTSEVLA